MAMIPVTLLLSSIGVFAQGGIESNTVQRARAAALLAADSAADAGVLRDVAVNALRNAVAAQNEAEDAYLAAIKSGDMQKRSGAKKVYAAVGQSTAAALEMLEQVADLAGEAAVALESARQHEKNVAAAKTQREAESAAKKVEKAAEAAAKVTRKAREIVEVLKKVWLLPVPVLRPAVTAGVDSAVQPVLAR